MLTPNSPISEIALEAKDVSDDVKGVSLAIEASCKHIDHDVSSMPLSNVPKFVDDYPVPGITINPGMVGYGVDTKNNDYDITHIFEKQIYNVSDMFEYKFQGKLPVDVVEFHMFSDKRIVQRGTSVIYFSDETGDNSMTVTEPYAPNKSYMYHGSFYGVQDLYLTGIQRTNAGSRYYINAYNSLGDRVSTTFIKSEYNAYYDFAFDGEFYYILSGHTTTANARYIDKHNLSGDLVSSFPLPTGLFDHINCTDNYIFIGLYSSSLSVSVPKDFSESFTIKNINSSGTTISGSQSMYGLDYIVVTYGGFTVTYDLASQTFKYHGQYTLANLTYFGSYVLMYSSGILRILDRSFGITSIQLTNLPRAYTQIASNGESLAGKYILEKHMYDSKATKQLACLAKKRG